MSPEEADPVDPAVAVEDPPVETPVETPEVIEKPAEQAPEGDAPPVEGDDETPPDPEAALEALIQNIAENDPDKLAAAIDKLPEEQRARYLGPDEKRARLEQDQYSGNLATAVSDAQKLTATYTDQNISAEIAPIMRQMAQVSKDRATAYRDEREGSTANVVDADAWTPMIGQKIGNVVTNAKTAQASQTRLEVLSEFIGAMQEAFPVKLTTADVKTLQGIQATDTKDWMNQYAATYVGALQRNGVNATEGDSEATKQLNDQIATINKQFGGSGRKATGGGESQTKGPTTLDEIDEALRTGPTADIDKLLKRRAVLTG